MALSVVKLRREYEVRIWRKIIEESPYIAVVQSTGGRSWGRTNMKAQILGGHLNNKSVGARYAIPKAAREGAMRTRFNQLSMLFRTSGSAVVYGHEVGPVVEVVKKARELINGSLLLGGRFGNDVVTARAWETILESDGEVAEWGRLIAVLDRPPQIIQMLDRSSQGLLGALTQGGRAHQLAHVIEQIGNENSPG